MLFCSWWCSIRAALRRCSGWHAAPALEPAPETFLPNAWPLSPCFPAPTTGSLQGGELLGEGSISWVTTPTPLHTQEFPAKILPPLFTPHPTFTPESFPSVLQTAVQKGDGRIQGFSEMTESWPEAINVCACIQWLLFSPVPAVTAITNTGTAGRGWIYQSIHCRNILQLDKKQPQFLRGCLEKLSQLWELPEGLCSFFMGCVFASKPRRYFLWVFS